MSVRQPSAVVGHVEGAQALPTIIGVGESPNTGMRKGTVVNLVNAASAIDKALELAERMSGFRSRVRRSASTARISLA